MNDSNGFLQALFSIVKNVPHPLQYHCTTRELMLRLQDGWSTEQIDELAQDELIEVKKSGMSIVIVMTEKGLEKAKQSATLSKSE